MANMASLRTIVENFCKKNNLNIVSTEEFNNKYIVGFRAYTNEGEVQVQKQQNNSNHRNIERYDLYLGGKRIKKSDW